MSSVLVVLQVLYGHFVNWAFKSSPSLRLSTSHSQRPPCSKARLSRASKYLDLDPNGGWGMWQNGTVFQSVRSHVWYFSLSACGPGNENMNNSTRQILFEARFLQADDSEFSVELKGMLTFHVMYI